MHARRRARGQTGASLALVLALIAFLSLLVPAVLGLAFTGSRVTIPVKEDRRETYAASSAIDAAVALGRQNADVGVPGGPCPDQTLSIDGLDVTVHCSQHDPPADLCVYLDRFVTYTAEVRKPGDTAVIARSTAEVVFRFNLDGPPTPEIRQFTPELTGSVTTLPLPPCAATTTSSTSTTTTTTAPVAGSYAVWGVPSTDTQNGKDGKQWRAVGPLDVTDHTGAGLKDAQVTVTVKYQKEGDPLTWYDDTPITAVTTATGSVTFHSKWYSREQYDKKGIKRVTQVIFTVQSVVTTQSYTWNSAAHPVTVTVTVP